VSEPGTRATRFQDRLNPILVKEVRAALRGWYFRITFPVIVIAAVLIGMMVLFDVSDAPREGIGRDFFGPIYIWMCVALFGLVPFSAFLSLGAEWDENTYDLLVISDLRPRQIVLGKLFSAAIEALLYFSAFAPLLVFTFLLRGIDIVAVVGILAGTGLACLSVTALALALSSLARVRVARVLLLAILAAGVVLAIAAATSYSQNLLLRRGGSGGTLKIEEVATVLLVIAAFGLLGFTVACERLAHPEENHSTGPRLLVTFLLLMLLGWVSWMELGARSVVSRDAHQPLILALLVLGLGQLFFVTENESLTRRVRRQVPANPVLACLAIPFLPGGGRGVLLFFLHLELILGVGCLINAVDAWRNSVAVTLWFPHGRDIVAFSLYMFLYLAGPSLPFSWRASSPLVRIVARAAIPILALLSLFVPALVGFLVSEPSWVELRHPFNPFYVVDDYWSGGNDSDPVFFTVAALALGVLLLSLPRISRSIVEVLEASRERRARAPVARLDTAAEESGVRP
jgi:ABC-type transport system involved in multi-copper enzyme maturation permease subunit